MLEGIRKTLDIYLRNNRGQGGVQLPGTRLPIVPVCGARATDSIGVVPHVRFLTMETTYG